ncbi:MAG: translocation/assembly module TamB, partial [Muribaculaceae bacterium]|nr:translocation/assembly module TamB [Muribaculaceae bacterium]
FATLWPGKRFAGYRLSSGIDIDLEGRDIDNMSGHIAMNNVDFRNDAGEGIGMKHFEIARDVSANPQTVELESDFINGSLQGALRPSTLVGDLLNVVGGVFPALGLEQQNGRSTNEHTCGNDFLFEFSVAEAEELSRFLSLPVQVINPIEISGHVNCAARDMSLALDAPYLQQADKIIDNTVLYAACDGLSGRASVYATTHMPTKKGPIAAILNIGASANRISTSADWTIERSIPLNGTLAFDTELGRGNDGNIAATIDFRPGTINFGDDVWDIRPSRIRWADGAALVNNFILEAGEQRVAVNGELSPAVEPGLDVAINKVNLLPIFETLEIDKALIGGTATGLFKGQALMSKSPILTSERLHVDNIGYNYCTLGNADITATWDNVTGNVLLDAVVTGFDGRNSHINGSIGPADETLDITFEADRVPVGFMQPYMSAFASAGDGYASGRAHLFGTFKYIDLDGDIFADSLSLKIDFTNTQYFCNDSIHMRPGEIIVPNVKILDVYGHTAALDGIVRHKFFKEPSFDFKVSDAREFLCYNVGPKQSPDWYGTIFGRGGAHIYGEPGVVNIDVNMSTTAGSTFTFVLSDMLEADEYSFITFRDRTPVEIHDSIVEVDLTPKAVLEYRQRMAAEMEEPPTDYNMAFRVDVTPEARVIIVMDPVGGDEIKANGSGNLRLTYGSANNDLRMFGTYTLDRGSYNFTLQDIIIKDFTIDEGSSISFHGDPYAAQLNIEAVYQVNANLSDLDESFLQDRELNRTNVPVQALMKVTGDMRQPDIDFDLRFPTLSSDVYRKVRSIVSTEDMMNRQIIYLLALNRFYTPDYMSTTKGNELFSVASSTISSQLSSMLGKLSDNWTIAPNLRSDRGDFSDVEVDVALSSRLLNNRLLFNGNFGYRDKSLNTNQFVGDFDIEYLLNRKGTWRLKAYNRYNDQNYYLRTADTTQGVGIMFKRDFDSLLGWLKPFRKRKESTEKMPADSVPNR